jgi:hypothetical protein
MNIPRMMSINQMRLLLSQSNLDQATVDSADALLARLPTDQIVKVNETNRQVAVKIYERRMRRELKSGAIVDGTQELLTGLKTAGGETVWMTALTAAERPVIVYFDSTISAVLGFVVGGGEGLTRDTATESQPQD